LVHRKVFGMKVLKFKEHLEAEMGKIEGYLQRLEKQMVFVKTTETEARPGIKHPEHYKTSIKL
jgi:hypothetical protein